MIFKKAAFFVLIPFICLAACAPDPGPGGKEGISGTIPAVDSLVQREIAAGHIPGAVVQIKKENRILHRAAYGFAQKYEYGMRPLDEPDSMHTDHLFDLASLTKVMGTTLGVMLLADAGSLSPDDPVHQYLDSFQGPAKSKVTIRHLLSHTSGLPQWVPTYYHASNAEERFRYMTSLPLKWPVGKERHYSDLGFMLLGDIIERVSGRRLDDYLHQEVYGPLNLQYTIFNPLDEGFPEKAIAATSHGNPFEKQMVYDDDFGYDVNVAPQAWDGWREYTLRGEVNDGNAWHAHGGVAGHAGLFSTVDDLQVLLDLWVNGGKMNEKQFLSASVMDTFLTKGPQGNGLGWAMEKHIISAEGSPDGTFGHTGFTGTSVVVVPEDSLSVILLTNRQNAGRQENGYYFDLGPLRQAIFDEAVGGH
ncbi:serine hydrolase domain-containing protein [Fodinibius sp.]|uniref:serine hydrolase domain-containing protein n=1 Tax=Fodinibius sp. TaxID=1872440 RepID=UPI003564313B